VCVSYSSGRSTGVSGGLTVPLHQGNAIPPKAVVEFENVTLMVDERMKWEKIKI